MLIKLNIEIKEARLIHTALHMAQTIIRDTALTESDFEKAEDFRELEQKINRKIKKQEGGLSAVQL